MSHLDIIRAWKDEEYRLSLSTAERAQLPEHPAGVIELTCTELNEVAGGRGCDSNGSCDFSKDIECDTPTECG
jgi:mersacidin/lichenicidin family type 2 lantibiotic